MNRMRKLIHLELRRAGNIFFTKLVIQYPLYALGAVMVNWLGNKSNYPAGHCQFCGYNLTSIRGEPCPECGKSRFAWIEAECEKCRQAVVFQLADGGRVCECPFCGGAVDVPSPLCRPAASGDSIAGTRFSLASFIIIFGGASLLAIFVMVIGMALLYWITTGHQPPASLVFPVILVGAAVGALAAVKYSYR